MWEVTVTHDGLHKYRVVKGRSKLEAEEKAQMQLNQWELMWQKKLERERKQHEREIERQLKQEQNKIVEDKIMKAEMDTQNAQNEIDELKNILSYTLDIDDSIEWENLKISSKYTVDRPQEPHYKLVPDSPKENDKKYQVDLNFIEKIITSLKDKKIEEANNQFSRDLKSWEKEKERISNINKKMKDKHVEDMDDWLKDKEIFEKGIKEINDRIEDLKSRYFSEEVHAIVEHAELVLSNSNYPQFFPQEFEVDFNPDTKILIVDYQLPNPELLPSTKEVKYIKSRDEFKSTKISQAELNRNYDSVIYQTILRTLHELFEADEINAINSIALNGWVNSIDKSTGNEVDNCILSVHTNKEEFELINLANVEPKECFKKLKGVGSSKMHSLTAVAPVVKMNKEDSRFVDAYSIVDDLSSDQNLAAMDWQDFEHLIRELFEKEFNQNGGEVKITQASRDGGVDAIAFDPDPIRGGKIVIQAKRYTNTVGVSAVRDLYGTVLNEGATKGILVSTSDYGPDAHNFAQNKPITLLNGNNLLYLLENHGYKMKIDIKEAKKLMN